MAESLPRAFGAYDLLKPLGGGGMGDVFLARPTNAFRGVPTPIVIKRLHAELAEHEEFVRRFLHEAQFAVAVDSPYVAKVYDVGKVDDTLYLAMEYLAGWPLLTVFDAIRTSKQPPPLPALIDLIEGSLWGLEAIHNARDAEGRPLGMVHRDISPRNLMVGEDGVVRVIDFGLGRSSLREWKTRTGTTLGSVGYLPPEQVGDAGVDGRADLYAVGVVMFELLTMTPYIMRGTVSEMIVRSVMPTFRPPSGVRPDLPPAIDAVLARALSLSPDGRYATAGEFLAAIRAIVPEAESRGRSARLIRELFSEEIAERRAELAELIALPAPATRAQSGAPAHLESYFRRAGVEPDLAPTAPHEPAHSIDSVDDDSPTVVPDEQDAITLPLRGVTAANLLEAVRTAPLPVVKLVPAPPVQPPAPAPLPARPAPQRPPIVRQLLIAAGVALVAAIVYTLLRRLH